VDKRISEASALRTFFSEQWRYLLGLISGVQKRREEKLSAEDQVAEVIEHIVEQVDSRIRGVGNYHKQLRSSARELISHVKDIVAELPQAITIDRNSYIDNPLFNTLFPGSHELHQLVIESCDIKKFSKEHLEISDFGLYVPDFYALLFVIRDEQQIFGSKLNGDVMQREVPQTAVHFIGHQLVSPSPTELDARKALERILFESTIVALRSNLVKLRYSQSDEEKKAALLNPEQNMDNPEVYLKLLTDQLRMSKTLISIHNSMLRVNRMGIKLPDNCDERANEVNLNEIETADSQSKVVLLVKVSHSEWI